MGKEQERRRQRSLKTVSHIVNKLAKSCIIRHTVKIYQKDDLMIVDVDLAHFLNDVRQFSAISQVSAQLLLSMYSRHGENFDLLEYFDWEVIKDGDTEGSRCFIRFTIFPKRFVPFIYCNKCGKKTRRPYGGPADAKRLCKTHGILTMDDCTASYKNYKRLPKKMRGIKWVR